MSKKKKFCENAIETSSQNVHLIFVKHHEVYNTIDCHSDFSSKIQITVIDVFDQIQTSATKTPSKNQIASNTKLQYVEDCAEV